MVNTVCAKGPFISQKRFFWSLHFLLHIQNSFKIKPLIPLEILWFFFLFKIDLCRIKRFQFSNGWNLVIEDTFHCDESWLKSAAFPAHWFHILLKVSLKKNGSKRASFCCRQLSKSTWRRGRKNELLKTDRVHNKTTIMLEASLVARGSKSKETVSFFSTIKTSQQRLLWTQIAKKIIRKHEAGIHRAKMRFFGHLNPMKPHAIQFEVDKSSSFSGWWPDVWFKVVF